MLRTVLPMRVDRVHSNIITGHGRLFAGMHFSVKAEPVSTGVRSLLIHSLVMTHVRRQFVSSCTQVNK